MQDISLYKERFNDRLILNNPNLCKVKHLAIDSRNILYPSQTLFFAIKGNVRDGHEYISKVYDQGVRNFVISDVKKLSAYNDVNYIVTEDVVGCLQEFAQQHREEFPDLKTVAITGSNGKTIVKEWLSILLSKKFKVVKSPKSYNSQIGVPLSVWQINSDHEIGIFEAGISERGEMESLAQIIQPQIGILTNIGDAHQSAFSSKREKLIEKLKLFTKSKTIIYNGDDELIDEEIKKKYNEDQLINWGYKNHNMYQIIFKDEVEKDTQLKLSNHGKEINLQFSALSNVFFENVMHTVIAALTCGLAISDIEEGLNGLESPDMRLNISEGRDGILLVNDSYTLDLSALKIAVDFTNKHSANRKKYLILSEESIPLQSKEILSYVSDQGFEKIYLIGTSWGKDFKDNIHLFDSADKLLMSLENEDFENGIILIKGARIHGLEKVVNFLSFQSHSVSLDIDLNAIENNLSAFASLLSAGTEIIPIIKASAYGSGSDEVAKILQHKGVKALGVAFADEGVRLRKIGITIPIIVLNPDEGSYGPLSDYKLDFEVYSIDQLNSILKWKNGKLTGNKIHIKLDTGMSRLGFQAGDIAELKNIIKENKLNIGSIFSHLSSSEDSEDDGFSHLQAKRFLDMYGELCTVINYKPMRHLLNSSGIIRFPEYHFEAVRLGLGLYGIDSTEILKGKLEKVHTLKARVIQIKKVKAGDYIGYNRRHKVESDMTIGILNIGYADGFVRLCGNSRYEVLIQNSFVKIIGNICMDLSIVDITNQHHIKVNDEVIIFGQYHPIEKMAEVCQTIPYEILCRIAPRVKRNYKY